MTDHPSATDAPMRVAPGLSLALVVLAIYAGIALSVNFPVAAGGIQSDEATYYMMGHSLAEDGDLSYRAGDLERVWREFPSGPSGVFLKKGRELRGVSFSSRPPFVAVRTAPDPDQGRLFFGKAFIYPLVAAPLVRLFGTNGFLLLHAILLALTVLCAYLFLHARAPVIPSALLASAFVLATVVPVYYVWITPELFNFSIVLMAYFCWLFKEVAPKEGVPRGLRWLLGPGSDVIAAVLLGIAAFSKIPNILLYLPIAVWHVRQRRWRSLVVAGAVCCAVTAGLFGTNLLISGEWNYQGGDRSTFYTAYPFQRPGATFDAGMSKVAERVMWEVLLDREVFWTNLTYNLQYYFIGRYSGLVAYFFPAVFLLVGMVVKPRRPLWQYLVLGACLVQILFFIFTVPYTWFGGGGSVGNRYFMGPYGAFLFLAPAITGIGWSVVPWLVGALFTAQLVLNPFATSIRPGVYAGAGPLRLLPVELTNVNDLPINTDPSRVRVWFGDNPGVGDPGFQIYFLDENAYGREEDKSFWVRGESRAEFLIKTDRPFRRALVTCTAGPVATEVSLSIGGRSQTLHLAPGESQQVTLALDNGFPYQRRLVWVGQVSSSAGFSPVVRDPASTDTRYLGVRVKPILVP